MNKGISSHLSPMNLSVVQIIVLGLLFFHVEGQNISNSQDSEPVILKPVRPSLALVIGIISVMLSIIFLVLAYAKMCQRIPVDFLDQDGHQVHIQSRSRFSGIDKTVIDSLPFFTFSLVKGSKEGLECAVCISRFEDTDILRLLPKCKHAFHKNCIDKWLQSHCSCPICRHRLDSTELKTFPYTNSLRFPLQNPSNLSEEPNLEIFVQREQDQHPPGSSRFSFASSCQGNDKGKRKELLLMHQDGCNADVLHKFKHKIIVSDVVVKNRWSDVNSSDLLSLNSEMLNVQSSCRFSPLNSSSSTRLYHSLSKNETVEKIKEDIERKRLYESKISRVDRTDSFSNFSLPGSTFNQENSSKMINPAAKRSISEIVNVSRFSEVSLTNKNREPALSPRIDRREERTRKIWLPMAQRTVRWFASRERNLPQSEQEGQESNV